MLCTSRPPASQLVPITYNRARSARFFVIGPKRSSLGCSVPVSVQHSSYGNYPFLCCSLSLSQYQLPSAAMSTLVWPSVPADQLVKEEQSCLVRELEWLLSALQDTLQSLKAGLEECADLLAPKDVGSTLVLSSHRSESLKGFITRVGTRVIKGDIHLRLPSLPPPRGQGSYKLSISSAPTAPTLVLEQLTSVRTLINSCLDVVDATRWTGDAGNANFISGQLKLLHDNVQEAKQALKGGTDVNRPWNEDPLDDKVRFQYFTFVSLAHRLSLFRLLTLRCHPMCPSTSPLAMLPFYFMFGLWR